VGEEGDVSAVEKVAASGIVEKYMKLAHGIEIVAFVSSVGSINMSLPAATHPAPSTSLSSFPY
jgi:chorismate synthase